MKNPLKHTAEHLSELLRAFLGISNDAAFVLCDKMKFRICNKIAEEWFDASEVQLTDHDKGMDVTQFINGDVNIRVFTDKFEEVLAGTPVRFECQLHSEASEIRWVEFAMKRVDVLDDILVMVVGRDITDKKHIQDEIIFESSHDHLTRLYTREFFIHFVQSRIIESKKNQTKFCVVILNIKRFRIFNEVLGHRLADNILKYTSSMLEQILPGDHRLARYGANEYAFICEHYERGAIVKFMENLLLNFKDPLLVDTSGEEIDTVNGCMPVNLDFSAGIAIYPEHAEHADLLTLRAELAIKHRKKSKSVFSFFELNNEGIQGVHDLEFVDDFKKALSEDQFVVFFQPKIRLSDEKIIGAEILSRWLHPERGILAPDTFLPLAEEMNLFRVFSRLLINKSFDLISLLSKKYRINFAVNLSPYNLLESDFVEFMKKSLEVHKIDALRVTLEITETGMMIDKDLSNEVLHQLSGLGFSIAVDDFGIGYTSLSYLQRLPLHELKIDRTFITDIHKNFNNSVIVKSLVLLGQSLGMYITAEGVEQQEEVDILKQYGCNVVQGYFYAKPMSFEKFKDYLEMHNV